MTDTSGHGRIGVKIRFRLIELKKDQAWLAAQCGWSDQRVSKLMRQDTANTRTLSALCDALQVTPSFWF